MEGGELWEGRPPCYGRRERVEEGSTSQVLSQVKSCFHSGGVRVGAAQERLICWANGLRLDPASLGEA